MSLNINYLKRHIKPWIKAIRLYQWSKNILLFLPFLMSHRLLEIDLVIKLIIAFISFGLSASAGYILNDISDLESDKKHQTKKKRPFVSGQISIKSGRVVIPFLLLASFLLAYKFLPTAFIVVLIIYILTTIFYSAYLKERIFIDVIVLGALYTLRVLAGGLTTGIDVSTWLLGFAWFFFLSLAFMKRYTDLLLIKKTNEKKLYGRGYIVDDIDMVQQAGLISGFMSILVLTLYINSDYMLEHYKSPMLLWFTIPVLLFWLLRMWLIAKRGNMVGDPVVFSIKDKGSYVIFILVLVILTAAATSNFGQLF